MTWSQISRAELLDRSGDDPMVRWTTTDRVLAVGSDSGWAYVHPWRPGGHWGGLAAVRPGAPAEAETRALAALCTLAAAEGIVPEWFSTEPGRTLTPPDGLRVTGIGAWTFMWTDSDVGMPAAPDGLVELDDTADAAEIDSFGRKQNPDFEGFPGRGFASHWLGVRDGPDVVAVGAVHVLDSGAPHLAGIVVHHDARGRGLGGAITAELSRRAIADSGVVTLGVYTANHPAIRLYQRLGFRSARQMETRRLVAG